MENKFTPSGWNELIGLLPNPHLLQTWEWGALKGGFGWAPYRMAWYAPSGSTRDPAKITTLPGMGHMPVAAAQVLVRRIPLGGFAPRLGVVYAPKGPLLDWKDAGLRKRVLADLIQFSKKKGGIFLKIDPDVRMGSGVPGEEASSEDPFGTVFTDELKENGWLFSSDQIQYRNSVLVDLNVSEDEMLARMKQKTRYNVRLAGRKGVAVRAGGLDDLPLLYKMYAETSSRDGFAIRAERYYLTLWRSFLKAGMMVPLIAEVEGDPVAGMCLFMFAGTSVYMHGMSLAKHRNKMPTYLLQWEAMRVSKAAGCSTYDLWGAPDVFDETDSMWGVFRFKRGLGGEVVRTTGAWDVPLKPLVFKLYTRAIPRLLDIMRNRRA